MFSSFERRSLTENLLNDNDEDIKLGVFRIFFDKQDFLNKQDRSLQDIYNRTEVYKIFEERLSYSRRIWLLSLKVSIRGKTSYLFYF